MFNGNGQSQFNPSNIHYGSVNPYQFNTVPSTPSNPGQQFNTIHSTPSGPGQQFGTIPPTPSGPGQHFGMIIPQQPTQTNSVADFQAPSMLPPSMTAAPAPAPMLMTEEPAPKLNRKKTSIAIDDNDDFSDYISESENIDSSNSKMVTQRHKPSKQASAGASSIIHANATPSISPETISYVLSMPKELIAMHPEYQKLQQTTNALAEVLATKQAHNRPSAGNSDEGYSNNSSSTPRHEAANSKYTDDEKKAMFFDMKDACDAFQYSKKNGPSEGDPDEKHNNVTPLDLPMNQIMFISPGVLMPSATYASMQKWIQSMIVQVVFKWELPAGKPRNRTNFKHAYPDKYEEFLKDLCSKWKALGMCELMWKADVMVGRGIKYANRKQAKRSISTKTEDPVEGAMDEDNDQEADSKEGNPNHKPIKAPEGLVKTGEGSAGPSNAGPSNATKAPIGSSNTNSKTSARPKPTPKKSTPFARIKIPTQGAAATTATPSTSPANPGNPQPNNATSRPANEPTPVADEPAINQAPTGPTVNNSDKPSSNPEEQLESGSTEPTSNPTVSLNPVTTKEPSDAQTTTSDPNGNVDETTLKNLDRKTLSELLKNRDIGHKSSVKAAMIKALGAALPSNPLSPKEISVIQTALKPVKTTGVKRKPEPKNNESQPEKSKNPAASKRTRINPPANSTTDEELTPGKDKEPTPGKE
ncbi:hypothetical protein CF327_g4428 [Tilletia walkeri]|nr:hypothetical protein CF327_g4428 [Tilletia walkeri]